MGHYDRKTRDCTDEGHEHEWGSLRARHVDTTVVFQDGEPHFCVEYQQYRPCMTEMEYHAGRRTGVRTGTACERENDVERKRFLVPLDEVSEL